MERLIDLLKRIMPAINRNDEMSDEFQIELNGIRKAACCFGIIVEPVTNVETDYYDYVGFNIIKNKTTTYYEL